MFGKKVILATHNGSFHADDVFACAVLTLFLRQQGQRWKIIRTRDEYIIAGADYVFDVGQVYDHTTLRYDHHQKDGAGQHDSGIPYASFGLVWKHYGRDLCEGDENVWQYINNKLVQPIDAVDTGTDLVEMREEYNLFPYSIQSLLIAFAPSRTERQNHDKIFIQKLVPLAREILSREIKKASEFQAVLNHVRARYEKSEDKRLLILTMKMSRREAQAAMDELDAPGLLYVVVPDLTGGAKVLATRKDATSFDLRRRLPEAWGGAGERELQDLTGIIGAKFCHTSGFMCAADSVEGAIELARLALSN